MVVTRNIFNNLLHGKISQDMKSIHINIEKLRYQLEYHVSITVSVPHKGSEIAARNQSQSKSHSQCRTDVQSIIVVVMTLLTQQ